MPDTAFPFGIASPNTVNRVGQEGRAGVSLSMKRLLLLLVLLQGLQSVWGQGKYALLVAVGQYPPSSRLRPISAVTDLKYLRTGLLKNGFAAKDIDSLVNQKATKKLILDKLTALARKVKKGDIVVISFGCHGQQIRDQRTPELGKDEDDGYDEALLPYDASGFYNPTGYKGENHLRDDDLHPKLLDIRKKIGATGSLLVLLDACHSGTGTRADDFPASRGEPVPFPDPDNPYDPAQISDTDSTEPFFDEKSDSLSNMVVISGSGPHQVNKQMIVDRQEVGSLSYAFYKAITEMPADNDYAILFQKIKATIQAVIPEQVPMVEGNTHQVIFSGKYLPAEERDFVRVGSRESGASADDSVFIFNKGQLDNVTAGLTGNLYLAGKNERYAHAVIRRADPFASVGVADKLLKKNESYELRLDEESYGSFSATVKLNKTSAMPARLEKQVQQYLAGYSFIRIDNAADFLLQVDADKTASLVDRNRTTWWKADVSGDTLSTADKKQLITDIRQAMRTQYIRSLPDGGDLAPLVTARIIPAGDTTQTIFRAGDNYALRINNNSKDKLFYTVLDIYPDNHVEVLYPSRQKEPADYTIEKNNFVQRKLSVSAGTASGVEFLKIIVSKEPMDLRGVFDRSIRREAMGSFQSMLDDLFNDHSGEGGTRADITAVKTGEVGIITVQLTIQQ